jgi:hypothetical protein
VSERDGGQAEPDQRGERRGRRCSASPGRDRHRLIFSRMAARGGGRPGEGCGDRELSRSIKSI